MRRVLIVGVAVMMLVGCSVVMQSRDDTGIGQDLTGMTQAEVMQLKGEPLSRRTMEFAGKEYEVWVYPGKAPGNVNINTVGRFNYQVYFLDGVVDSWDKVNVLSKPTYEYDEPDSSGADIRTLEVQKL